MKQPLALLTLILGLMPVMAQAAVVCTASATSVAFGTVQFSAVNSTGTVSITCTANDSNITVALSTGGSGSYSPRKMSSGSNKLNYNLYKDSARTLIWGNGTGGTATNGGGASLGVPLLLTVYGQVPAQVMPAPGSYSDTITVTVTY